MKQSLNRYYIVRIQNGTETLVSNLRDPLTHHEACTMKSKFTNPNDCELREYATLYQLFTNS